MSSRAAIRTNASTGTPTCGERQRRCNTKHVCHKFRSHHNVSTNWRGLTSTACVWLQPRISPLFAPQPQGEDSAAPESVITLLRILKHFLKVAGEAIIYFNIDFVVLKHRVNQWFHHPSWARFSFTVQVMHYIFQQWQQWHLFGINRGQHLHLQLPVAVRSINNNS